MDCSAYFFGCLETLRFGRRKYTLYTLFSLTLMHTASKVYWFLIGCASSVPNPISLWLTNNMASQRPHTEFIWSARTFCLLFCSQMWRKIWRHVQNSYVYPDPRNWCLKLQNKQIENFWPVSGTRKLIADHFDTCKWWLHTWLRVGKDGQNRYC
jgi:hypothetical protein